MASRFVPKAPHRQAGIEYVRTSWRVRNGQGLLDVINTAGKTSPVWRGRFRSAGSRLSIPAAELSRLRTMAPACSRRATGGLASTLIYEPRIRTTSIRSSAIPTPWRRGSASPGHPTSTPPFAPNWASSTDHPYRLRPRPGCKRNGGFNGRTVAELAYRVWTPMLATPGGSANWAQRASAEITLLLHKRFGIPETGDGDVTVLTRPDGLPSEHNSGQLAAMRLCGVGTLLPVDFSRPRLSRPGSDVPHFLDPDSGCRPVHDPVQKHASLGGKRTAFWRFVMGATYVHRRIRNLLVCAFRIWRVTCVRTGITRPSMADPCRVRTGPLVWDGITTLHPFAGQADSATEINEAQ